MLPCWGSDVVTSLAIQLFIEHAIQNFILSLMQNKLDLLLQNPKKFRSAEHSLKGGSPGEHDRHDYNIMILNFLFHWISNKFIIFKKVI